MSTTHQQTRRAFTRRLTAAPGAFPAGAAPATAAPPRPAAPPVTPPGAPLTPGRAAVSSATAAPPRQAAPQAAAFPTATLTLERPTAASGRDEAPAHAPRGGDRRRTEDAAEDDGTGVDPYNLDLLRQLGLDGEPSVAFTDDDAQSGGAQYQADDGDDFDGDDLDDGLPDDAYEGLEDVDPDAVLAHGTPVEDDEVIGVALVEDDGDLDEGTAPPAPERGDALDRLAGQIDLAAARRAPAGHPPARPVATDALPEDGLAPPFADRPAAAAAPGGSSAGGTAPSDALDALAGRIDLAAARQILTIEQVGRPRRRPADAAGPLDAPPSAERPAPSAADAAADGGPEAASASRVEARAGKAAGPARQDVTEALAARLQASGASTVTLDLEDLHDLGLPRRNRRRDAVNRVLLPWLAVATIPGWTLSWGDDQLRCLRAATAPSAAASEDEAVVETPDGAGAGAAEAARGGAAADAAAKAGLDMAGADLPPRLEAPMPSAASPPPVSAEPGDGSTPCGAEPPSMPGPPPATAPTVPAPTIDPAAYAEAVRAETDRVERLVAGCLAEVQRQQGEHTAALLREIRDLADSLGDAVRAASRPPPSGAGMSADDDGSLEEMATVSAVVSDRPPPRRDRVAAALLVVGAAVAVAIAMPLAAPMVIMLGPLAAALVFLLGRRDETGELTVGLACSVVCALLFAAERYRADHLEATLTAIARALGGS